MGLIGSYIVNVALSYMSDQIYAITNVIIIPIKLDTRNYYIGSIIAFMMTPICWWERYSCLHCRYCCLPP